MTRDEIIDLLPDDDTQVTFFEPAYMDEAILGLTTESPGWPTPPRVCYSITKILEILQEIMECDYEDALDYFSFNIQGFGISDPPPPMLVAD